MGAATSALVVVLLVSGMLALGTVLAPGALAQRLRRPGALLLALAVNVVGVPALGLLAVRVVDLQPAVALGVVLATAAPGGGTGALLALHARGDVAHAVVLQVVLAAAALVVTPVVVALHAQSAGLDLPLVTESDELDRIGVTALGLMAVLVAATLATALVPSATARCGGPPA